MRTTVFETSDGLRFRTSVSGRRIVCRCTRLRDDQSATVHICFPPGRTIDPAFIEGAEHNAQVMLLPRPRPRRRPRRD